MNTILKGILAAALLGCLIDMPYSYYTVVRFLGMIGFAAMAYEYYQRKEDAFMILWGASAILINPLLKISLGRDLWNIVDVIWAALLVASILKDRSKEKQKP